MTQNGFLKTISSNSIKLQTLIKICEYFDTSINFFFNESNFNYIGDPNIKERVKLLKEVIKSKDETIEQLKFRIEEMKGEHDITFPNEVKFTSLPHTKVPSEFVSMFELRMMRVRDYYNVNSIKL